MAIFNLGVIHAMNSQDFESTKQMIRYYEMAEELAIEQSTHCFGALNNLGTCYQKGTGVDKNQEMAVKFYSLAAENGNSDAMRNLGMFHIMNDKKELGKNYLEKAAAKEHESSLRDLKEFFCVIF